MDENTPILEIANQLVLKLDYFEHEDVNKLFVEMGFDEDKVYEGEYTKLILSTLSLLCSELEYAWYPGGNAETIALNDKGRIIKHAGGHFAYEKRLQDEKAEALQRQLNKDKADEVSYKMAHWTYKNRKLPYIISSLSLLGTVISIVISVIALNYKPNQSAIQSMQQQIQQLKLKMTKQDSLLRVYNLQKIKK